MSAFDDLVKEVKEANLKAPTRVLKQVLQRTESPRPDALVLGVMRCTCSSCGSVWETPSHHLMLRFGRNFIHSQESPFVFGEIPRERFVKEEVVPKCDKCFGPVVHEFHLD